MGDPLTVGLFIIGGVAQHQAAERQEEAAEEAQEFAEQRAELEKKRADMQTARERARAVRAARAARGAALAQSKTGAGTGGSGLAGAQAAIGNQLAGGLAFMEGNQAISNQISSLNLDAAKTNASIQSDINRLNTVSSISQSAMGVFGQED